MSRDTFFIGHHLSNEYPDGEIIDERKVTGGAFVSLFHRPGRYSYQRDYFVCYRLNRKIRSITPFMPMEKDRFDNHDDVDAAFSEFVDEWGFETFDSARAYFDHVVNFSGDKPHPRIPVPYKSSRKRDAQRDKVYRWEGRFYKNRGHMSEEDIHKLCIDIAARFHRKFDCLRVSFRETTHSFQRGYWEVNFNADGRTRDVVVHEMAHWLTTHAYKNPTAHGPEYVGIFMLMLEQYCGQRLTDMINHALSMNIKFVFPEGGLEALEVQDEQMKECA